MNIFATHEDPEICAYWLDDKRVGKMLMEANQMMSQAVKEHVANVPCGEGLAVRGTAYRTHPCTLWAGATRGNFKWLLRHAYALAWLFEQVYGHRHASAVRTPFLETYEHCLPEGPLLPFQNSARNAGLGLDFTDMPVHDAYRVYLMERWRTDARSPTWKGREAPAWHLWDRDYA